MKKKFINMGFFCLFVLLVAVSCATTPPPEEAAPPGTTTPVTQPVTPQVTPPAGPQPDQLALDALNAAAARAAEARRRAIDFDSEALFPSEWGSAQALFNEAEQRRNTSTHQDVLDSTARFDNAADAFEALLQSAIAEAIRRVEEGLAVARNAAIAAGAEEYAPDFLAEADNLARRALREYEEGDYDSARSAALDAYAIYNAITASLEARRLRDEIARRGFESYDSANVNSGDVAFDAGMAAFANRNFRDALDRAEEALTRYTIALRTAWETLAWGRRDAASAERQRALDARANIAAREEFDPAEPVFNGANTALMRENFEEAIELYDECIPMFAASTRMALARRQAAQEALDRADRRLIESEQTAALADQIMEGAAE